MEDRADEKDPALGGLIKRFQTAPAPPRTYEGAAPLSPPLSPATLLYCTFTFESETDVEQQNNKSVPPDLWQHCLFLRATAVELSKNKPMD